MFRLPEDIIIHDHPYPIRTDFRVILEIFVMLAVTEEINSFMEQELSQRKQRIGNMWRSTTNEKEGQQFGHPSYLSAGVVSYASFFAFLKYPM